MRALEVASIADQPMAYPGRAPDRSWIIDVEGRVQWIQDIEDLPGHWRDERHAVLAIGSNRRPGRLAAHLSGCPDRLTAGLQVTVEGADIVYPAHVSSYGVCTATVIPCPEAVVHSWLLLLSRAQLLQLAAREELGQLFDLYRLSGVLAAPRIGGPVFREPMAFVHRHGPLPFDDGLPRRLWRVQAQSTPLKRASLVLAHSRLELILKRHTTGPWIPSYARKQISVYLPWAWVWPGTSATDKIAAHRLSLFEVRIQRSQDTARRQVLSL